MVSKKDLMAAIRRNIELGLYSDGKRLDLAKVRVACERVGISYDEYLDYNHGKADGR